MPIQPYKLKLEKVSKQRLKLLSAMYSYLPRTGLEHRFLSGLVEAVGGMLGDGFSLRLETLDQRDFASYRASLPAHPIIAVIGLAPGNQKLLLEIDSTLAMMAVERLLGGQVESMPEPRLLTETEQGVLQYLILKLLLQTHRACGSDARVHFRFDKFVSHPDGLARIAAEDAVVAVAGFRATLGRNAGFVRLAFTEPFLEQMLLDVPQPDDERFAEINRAHGELSRYAYVNVPLWAEVGRTTLTLEELKQLEEGDVVLFEGGDIGLSEGGEGRAILRLGGGDAGGLGVRVSLSPTRAHCTIEGLRKGE